MQMALYNEAAGELPRFKPATLHEVQRRTSARDFNPALRLFAEDGGHVVGYVTGNGNGRVSFPWCKKGCEAVAEPLFQRLLQVMSTAGHRQVFAAYRGDWPTVGEFFTQHGFRLAREMVNHVIDLLEMPTPPARPSSSIVPLRPSDVPAVMSWAPEALRVRTAAELEQHLLHNPYFPASSVFCLRSRSADEPVAVGILVTDAAYANPKAVDSAMPCFRLGAFGTETMQTKRINGLFSFLVRKDLNVNAVGLDLMGHAAFRLRDTDDLDCLAGQVGSDVTYLLPFYQRNFRRQGSFPVYEKDLGAG
jgi:hypothetical protein